MIKNIIFDFDGTLVDTKQQILFCFQESIKRLNLPKCTPEACTSTIGLPLKEAFIKLVRADDELANLCVQTYENVFRETRNHFPTTLFPQVSETIHALHRQNILTTVASSRQSSSIKHMLAERNLDAFFPYILGNDSVTEHKPKPEPVLKTMRELSLNAQETVVVGDTWFDMAMAKNAHVKAIGVTYGVGSEDSLRQAGAFKIINNISQLLTFLHI